MFVAITEEREFCAFKKDGQKDSDKGKKDSERYKNDPEYKKAHDKATDDKKED